MVHPDCRDYTTAIYRQDRRVFTVNRKFFFISRRLPRCARLLNQIPFPFLSLSSFPPPRDCSLGRWWGGSHYSSGGLLVIFPFARFVLRNGCNSGVAAACFRFFPVVGRSPLPLFGRFFLIVFTHVSSPIFSTRSTFSVLQSPPPPPYHGMASQLPHVHGTSLPSPRRLHRAVPLADHPHVYYSHIYRRLLHSSPFLRDHFV